MKLLNNLFHLGETWKFHILITSGKKAKERKTKRSRGEHWMSSVRKIASSNRIQKIKQSAENTGSKV